jgi:hypothetical protein
MLAKSLRDLPNLSSLGTYGSLTKHWKMIHERDHFLAAKFNIDDVLLIITLYNDRISRK